jgi:hypothetical protein
MPRGLVVGATSLGRERDLILSLRGVASVRCSTVCLSVCVCVCHSDCVFSSPPLRTSAPPFILQGVHVYKGSSVGMPVRSEWFLRSSEAGPLVIYGVSGSVGPLSWWWWPPVALLVQGLQPAFSC